MLLSGIGGGVALQALQLAVAAGADVWVTSGSEEKIVRAKALGALGGVSYKTPKWGRELAGQTGGFDLLLDSAAGEGFAELVDAAAPGGRIVLYGGTLGAIPNLAPPKVFFKHLDILGSTMGTEADFADMLQFVQRQQIRPVLDRTFALDDAEARPALSRSRNSVWQSRVEN